MIIPPPRNPKKPLTRYERYVRKAGLTISVFFLLVGFGCLCQLLTVDMTRVQEIVLLVAENIFMILGSVMFAVFYQE